MQNQINKFETPVFGMQRTLAKRAAVRGFGFWSGKDVLLEFLPAPENFGIRFLQTGLKEESAVSALLANRLSKPRQTSLGNEQIRFDMVEHVLSALNGLRIDNCLIQIDGEEMPGMDGSAFPFLEAVCKAGISEQSVPKRVRILRERVSLEGDWGMIEAEPSLSGEIEYQYDMDYSGTEFPSQLAKESCTVLFSPETDSSAELYSQEISRARTFLTHGEAELLLRSGLCKRVTHRDVLVFGKDGPIDNQLRYPNECARHKLLDMMGDFSLGGGLIVAHFHARCSGHRQNAELLAKILQVTEIE